MIRVLFFDETGTSCLLETPVVETSYTRACNKSGEWSVAIPLTAANFALLYEGLRMELRDGDRYCIGGRVQDIHVKYDGDALIEVKGREEIDELYDLEADPIFYPNNQLYIT